MTTDSKNEDFMEMDFNTLQEFMTHTKGIAYLLIGVALVVLPLFWKFVTGRDDKKQTF
jgi:hypothetical protein